MEKKVKSAIPFEIAKKMTKAFRNSESACDTKAVWFPAQQIIDMANALVREKADGLRVYFGRYTKEIIEEYNSQATEDDKIDPKHENKNTVIFVSTEVSKKTGNPKTDYFENTVPFVPENRGELCPEDCPGDPSPMNQD